MLGDPHLPLMHKVLSEHSMIFPYCQQLVVKNQRNSVKVIVVLYPPPSLTPLAWPDGMTRDEVEEIIAQTRSFLRTTKAHQETER
jgi:hypothetical protein